MGLPRCRKCGLPRRLSRGYIWPGNGTIISRRDPTMRMIFFESAYYPYMWSELENRLEVGISEIYIRGQKASVRDYLDRNVLYGWRRFIVRCLPFPVVIQRVINELALFGFGRLELLTYRRHRVVLVRVTNPFDIISLAWGAKGFCELVDEGPFEIAWFRDGDDYLLTAVPLTAYREMGEEERQAVQALREAKRELSDVRREFSAAQGGLESCRACGLPSLLTELEWREEKGVIYHRNRGTRIIFSSGHVLLSIVRELERLTGEKLEPLILEITKNYHLKSMPDVSERSEGEIYRELVNRLKAWGYGLPLTHSFGTGHLEITIGNPFYPPRVVGYIAAVFETVEGRESEISYRFPEPNVLRLEIGTA